MVRRKIKSIITLLLFGILAIVTVRNMSNVIFYGERMSLQITTKVTLPTTPAFHTTPAKALDKCPSIPKHLTKNITIDLQSLNSTSDINIKKVEPGGWYKPLDCQARHRVAVIVPYRNREKNLYIFMRYIHPYLQRQQLDYRIFLVEQTQEEKFNKAIMMNTGFVEANKLYEYDCFVFHDIDLLPEVDQIPYTCEKSPLHLSVAIDVRKYKLSYKTSFGGVTSFSPEHFKKVNGFSNLYFEWGGEDDDMHERVKYSKLKLVRLPAEVGRYKKVPHKKAKPNPDKGLLFKTMKARYLTDGLNSLRSNVVKIEYKPLFTWILVSVNETDVYNHEPIHKRAFKKPAIQKSKTSKTKNSTQTKPEH